MKKIISIIVMISMLFSIVVFTTGCEEGSQSDKDTEMTIAIGDKLSENQPTPTDIDYSLERYNLIRRTYWVNGMRDFATAMPCPIKEVPLGYVVLFSSSGAVIGRFTVNGKVSSLNSFLTPDSEYYEVVGSNYHENRWLPDVDGSYGINDGGIFFFTPDGKYIEWSGDYLYSDIPFTIENPVLTIN